MSARDANARYSGIVIMDVGEAMIASQLVRHVPGHGA